MLTAGRMLTDVRDECSPGNNACRGDERMLTDRMLTGGTIANRRYAFAGGDECTPAGPPAGRTMLTGEANDECSPGGRMPPAGPAGRMLPGGTYAHRRLTGGTRMLTGGRRGEWAGRMPAGRMLTGGKRLNSKLTGGTNRNAHLREC